MPEKINPHAQRLYDSLIKHAGMQSAERIRLFTAAYSNII